MAREEHANGMHGVEVSCVLIGRVKRSGMFSMDGGYEVGVFLKKKRLLASCRDARSKI